MLDTYYSHTLFKHSRLERHRTQYVFLSIEINLFIQELKASVLKNLEHCNLFALHTSRTSIKTKWC